MSENNARNLAREAANSLNTGEKAGCFCAWKGGGTPVKVHIDNVVVSARQFAGKWQAMVALLTACAHSRMTNANLHRINV